MTRAGGGEFFNKLLDTIFDLLGSALLQFASSAIPTDSGRGGLTRTVECVSGRPNAG